MTARKIIIGRPELVVAYRRPWFRSKNICLSMEDWQAFGDALSEACPDAFYARDLTIAEEVGDKMPIVRVHKHLCDCRESNGALAGEIWLSFSPDWRPKVVHLAEIGRWSIDGDPYWPNVRFLPRARIWEPDAEAPEHMQAGEIHIACEPENKGHVAFAQRFFRLLGQFASNRNQMIVHYPSYKVIEILEKGSDIWLGHGAVRWVRQDPKRLLAYELQAMSRRNPSDLGTGRRPSDEVAKKLP